MATGSETAEPRLRDRRAALLLAALGNRPIVLVGMMGSGKTSTGRKLAHRLGLPFVDADAEIEWAAGMTIAEIFSRHGEVYFRDGERRVMSRLLGGGPHVLATGGGAFIHDATRGCIVEQGLSVWLKAEFEVLMRRVRRRAHRPLLQTPDPAATLRRLMAEREPIYGRADVTVVSRDAPHESVVDDIVSALEFHLRFSPDPPATPPKLVSKETKTSTSATRSTETKVEVNLGPRTYDIHIGPGLLDRAGAEIARFAPKAACAIVTDANVAALHLPALTAGLAAAGIRHAAITVPPGEGSKSFAAFASVCDDIIAAKMERGDIVIALGGGVVGDLAGFAAASVRRGMRFVQIPTSLLAQVDSSVGGKTGINSPHGKNLIGAFHQPALVLADTDVLETLPKREFTAGYAEVAKYGLISDPGFFRWLEEHSSAVFAGGPLRAQAVARSCAAKAAVVARDEREDGERALLNLGHTFGHALERITGYDGARLVHGEAVSIGMACAFRFSTRLGHCPAADTARAVNHLAAVGLPTHIRAIAGWDADAGAICEAMFQDKKVERGALTFILVRGIGRAFVAKGVDPNAVQAFLQDELTTGL